jgi:hypothetical protein
MHKLAAVAAVTAVATLLLAQPALAKDNAKFVGSWRLMALDIEFRG